MSIRIGEQIISGGVPTSRTEALVNQNEGSTLENVYNWVGTTQEYEEQDVALLHPEWVCYITDDETHDDQEIEIIAYTARNVGDIFFTSRSDEWLNGAVECNGQTYSLADYSGDESINALLQANKIPYVSISDYEAAITAKGWCDKFGWDGVEASTFKVPTLTAKIIQENNLPVIGNGMTLGITDGTNNAGLVSGVNTQYGGLAIAEDYGVSVGTTSTGQTWVGGDITMGITTDATKSGMIADLSNDSANLRVMVQLSTGFNDESVETLHTLDTAVTELSSEVETIANSYVSNTSLTNCITKIPQNIKLELSNNTLTLKAGSKVYIPHGFEQDGETNKFDEVIISSDKTFTLSTSQTDQFFIVYNSTQESLDISYVPITTSGTTSPTDGLFYSCVSNTIEFYESSVSTTDLFSLPCGICTVDSTTIQSIDQVFNGFGYIGSTSFVLPGVQALLPNGKNPDGTCKSLIKNINNVVVYTFDSSYNISTRNRVMYLGSTEDRIFTVDYYVESDRKPENAYTLWYKPSENKTYYIGNDTIALETQSAIIGYMDRKAGTTIPLWNGMRLNPVAQLQTYTNIRLIDTKYPTSTDNTWYRVYSDGWIEQGGVQSIAAENTVINLPFAMATSTYTLQLTSSDDGDEHNVSTSYSAKTTTSFTCSITVNGARYSGSLNWLVCGRAAF